MVGGDRVEGMFDVLGEDELTLIVRHIKADELIFIDKGIDRLTALDQAEDSITAQAGACELEGNPDAAHYLNERINIIREYRMWLEETGWKD